MATKPESESSKHPGTSERKILLGHDLFRPLTESEQQSASEIKFTPENAQRHLATLISQLQAVFQEGKINIDRLDTVAHW